MNGASAMFRIALTGGVSVVAVTLGVAAFDAVSSEPPPPVIEPDTSSAWDNPIDWDRYAAELEAEQMLDELSAQAEAERRRIEAQQAFDHCEESPDFTICVKAKAPAESVAERSLRRLEECISATPYSSFDHCITVVTNEGS